MYSDCDACVEGFDNPLSLEYHIRFYHETDQKYHINDDKEHVREIQREEPNNVDGYPQDKSQIKIETDPQTIKAHNEISYKCEKCNKTFKSCFSLKRHRLVHTNEMPHECVGCGKTFKDSASFKKHHTRRTDLNKDIYKCCVCGKEFSKQPYLRLHLRIHTGEKPYKCNECGKAFTQSRGLKQHSEVHSTKNLQCDVCGITFKSARGLKIHSKEQHRFQHISMKHIPTYNYIGETSSRTILPKALLSLQYKSPLAPCSLALVPLDDPKNPVEYVYGTDFSISSNNKEDLKERPYKCNTCGKCFFTPSHLKHHSIVHSNERPYKCEVCGYAFKLSDQLRKHLKIHRDAQSQGRMNTSSELNIRPILPKASDSSSSKTFEDLKEPVKKHQKQQLQPRSEMDTQVIIPMLPSNTTLVIAPQGSVDQNSK